VEEQERNIEHAYFEMVGLLDIYPGEFITFPGLRLVEQSY
jgi:hypothetical protein